MTSKIVTVVGARPQFVKAAPVSAAMKEVGLQEVMVHSGQHYDDCMSDRFFRELDIPRPHYQLVSGSGSHAGQTGKMLVDLEKVIAAERPDWALVYGDTNTTLAAALAAAKLCVPVAHVEAGLRSGNLAMPEEINRIGTDRISSLLFTPTRSATERLLAEGHVPSRVVQSGDVMFDATLQFSKRARSSSRIISALGLKEGEYILSTIHRAENTGSLSRLTAILGGLARVGVPVCLPLHPRTAAVLRDQALQIGSTIRAIEPIGYLDMLQLLANAKLVVTDSGGLQKEAFFAGRPCVTVRDETEWPELVLAGWNRLTPPKSPMAVAEDVQAALSSPLPADRPAFFGDGHASRIIARELQQQ